MEMHALSQIVHVHSLWLKIRHTRHRTGVHTDAVTTSSGTPGPPIKHTFLVHYMY